MQGRGDLGVRVTLGGQFHDFEFAVGEVPKGEAGPGWRRGGEKLGDEGPGGAGGQKAFAGGDQADGVEESVGGDVLAEEAAGAGAEGAGDVVIVLCAQIDAGRQLLWLAFHFRGDL